MGTNDLVVKRDDVGDGGTGILDLNAAVGRDGVEDDRAVGAEGVGAVLPEHDRGDAVGKGG